MKKSFIGQGTAAKVSARLKKDVAVKKGFKGQGTAAVIKIERKK